MTVLCQRMSTNNTVSRVFKRRPDGDADRPEADGPWGVLLVRTPTQGGGGLPPPPLQTPKWLYGTMGFVGAGEFV